MKKKIGLIQPNSPFLMNERVFPNIGLLRVATQLKSEGHDITVLDFSGKNPEYMREYAYAFNLYGFSSTSAQFPYVMKLFNILKEENPNAKTILGGPHASAIYNLRDKGATDNNIYDLNNFDTIFAGEGENTNKIFKPGWQKGKVIKNIDSVKIPDRNFIDILSYEYKLFGDLTTSIQTQRGCPHQCAFCSGRDVEMYNKVRTHSPERVVKELDKLNDEFGYTSFMWYDDEINLDMTRLEKLCKKLSTKSYKHRGFIRSDNIVKYPDSVKWMKDAGFVKLCTGVESGSDRMLKNINKRTTSKINAIARHIIGNQDIHYEAFILLGHPDETISDILKTYDWIKDNGPDDFDLNLITPYPGSKMYDNAIPSSKFFNYKWEFNGMYFNKPRYSQEDSYYKGLDQQSHSNVRTNELSNRQLKVLRDSIDGALKK